ncbi:MAG: hypothetical protein KTR31_01420 [Myxococcales bacterium]|nr:hypothetical protein [Myxococcales bacterium]
MSDGPLRLAALLWIASCTSTTDPSELAHTDPRQLHQSYNQGGDGGGGGGGPGSSYFLEGKVFYDDFRPAGRFSLRLDSAGNAGQQVDFDGMHHNYLGALDAKVTVFELDPSSGGACLSQEVVGVGWVRANGWFVVEIPSSDPCTSDGDAIPEIAVRVSLESEEHTPHFSVRTDNDVQQGEGEVWEKYWPQATLTHPLQVPAAPPPLGILYFQDAAFDTKAMAAGVFASSVDVVRRFYVESFIPWPTTDDIVLEFPDDVGPSANGLVLHIPLPGVSTDDDQGDDDEQGGSSWVGRGIIHEMGHAMHHVEGGIGQCPGKRSYQRDGDDSWRPTSREWPVRAFSEGLASFVNRAALDTCGDATFDDNGPPNGSDDKGPVISNADPTQFPDTQARITYPHDGQSYARNVTRTLCDLLDSRNDDDPHLPGTGDHYTEDLAGIWYTLGSMQDPPRDCPDLCMFLEHYVDLWMGDHVVSDAMTDLAFNNGVSCGAPPAVPAQDCSSVPGSAPAPYDAASCHNATTGRSWCEGLGPDGEEGLYCLDFDGDVENTAVAIEDYGVAEDVIVFGDVEYSDGTTTTYCCHFPASDAPRLKSVAITMPRGTKPPSTGTGPVPGSSDPGTGEYVGSADEVHLSWNGYDIDRRSSRIYTGAGADLVVGGPGDDVILADDGDDTLRAMQGDDVLSGGADDDVCDGGRGQDTFVKYEGLFGTLVHECETGPGFVTVARVGAVVAGATLTASCDSDSADPLQGSGMPDSLTLECSPGDTLDVSCSFTASDAEVGMKVDGVTSQTCTTSPCEIDVTVDDDVDVACDFDEDD